MNEDTTNNWDFPVLPGTLRESRGCLEPGIRVQVRSLPTSDEDCYLVGIAHNGYVWHNLHTTPTRDEASRLAYKVHMVQNGVYQDELIECANMLACGEVDNAVAVAQGRLWGDKLDFLRKAHVEAIEAIAEFLTEAVNLLK